MINTALAQTTPQALANVDELRAAIACCETVDEAKQYRDQFQTMADHAWRLTISLPSSLTASGN